MEIKEIILIIFGGGGILTGIASGISWWLKRNDEKKKEKALEDAKHISESVESRKAEFDGLIRTTQFTDTQYQSIIVILSKAKESAEAEFRGMREKYEVAFDTIIELERKVNSLELSDLRCQETVKRLLKLVGEDS